MLLVGLPVKSRLLVGKFLGSKNYMQIFDCVGDYRSGVNCPSFSQVTWLVKSDSWPGPVTHACNPKTLGGWGGWIRSLRSTWATQQNPVSNKNTKISWARWYAPVVPATQEAEAGELPEPRRQRLRWAKIAPLHSSLGNTSETRSQKKE